MEQKSSPVLFHSKHDRVDISQRISMKKPLILPLNTTQVASKSLIFNQKKNSFILNEDQEPGTDKSISNSSISFIPRASSPHKLIISLANQWHCNKELAKNVEFHGGELRDSKELKVKSSSNRLFQTKPGFYKLPSKSSLDVSNYVQVTDMNSQDFKKLRVNNQKIPIRTEERKLSGSCSTRFDLNLKSAIVIQSTNSTLNQIQERESLNILRKKASVEIEDILNRNIYAPLPITHLQMQQIINSKASLKRKSILRTPRFSSINLNENIRDMFQNKLADNTCRESNTNNSRLSINLIGGNIDGELESTKNGKKVHFSRNRIVVLFNNNA